MDLAAAHTLYNALAGDRSSFLYSGSFPDDHTARLIALSEGFFHGTSVRRGQLSRLAFVMVEAYQNIIRHRAQKEEVNGGTGRSVFALRCGEGWQDVLTVNPVAPKDLPELRELLARIDGLDGTQLKELFLRGLQTQQAGRRGAGLGLIEMARRSGRGLQHELAPLPGGYGWFALRVRLGESDGAGGTMDPALQALVDQHDILLLHRGAVSASVQETFLRMAEVETGGHNSAVARTYLAVMEHLSECPHRADNAMVVIMARDQGYALAIAHASTPEESAELQAQIDTVRAMDLATLSHKYREGLLQRARGGTTKGLGLLDLARHAAGRLDHATKVLGNGGHFILITARC